MNNLPVIDMQELNEIMDNDIDLLKDCLNDFLIDCPDLTLQVKAAVESKDTDKITKAAHKIKGVLQYLAAEPAAQAAYDIEVAGMENKLDNIDVKLMLLESECQKVIEFINNFTN